MPYDIEVFGAAPKSPVKTGLPYGSVVKDSQRRSTKILYPGRKILSEKQTVKLITQNKDLVARRLNAKANTWKTAGRILAANVSPAALKGLDPSAVDDTQNFARYMVEKQEQAAKEIGWDDPKVFTPERRNALGVAYFTAMAGELSASYGLDISFSDLGVTCSDDLTRFAGWSSGSIKDYVAVVSYVGFKQILGVLKQQNANPMLAVTTADAMLKQYGNVLINGESQRRYVGDMTAVSESGVRRLIEGLVGKTLGQQALWYNDAAMRQTQGVMQGWIGKQGVDYGSSWINLAGGLLQSLGSVPYAGIILQIIGSVLTAIASILGCYEAPPEQEPNLEPCYNEASKLWYYDRQAWLALMLGLAARNRNDALLTGTNAINNARAAGWWANTNVYTGEIMITEPGSSAPRRFLDVFDRNTLIPDGRSEFLDWLHAGKASGVWDRIGFIPQEHFWCYLSGPMVSTAPISCQIAEEKFTGSGGGIRPFRQNVLGKKSAEVISGNVLLRSAAFHHGYIQASVLSLYLGGCMPYGVWRRGGEWYEYSLGVGGSQIALASDSVYSRVPWRMKYLGDSNCEILVPYAISDTKRHAIKVSELPKFTSDKETVFYNNALGTDVNKTLNERINRDIKAAGLADQTVSLRKLYRIPGSTPPQADAAQAIAGADASKIVVRDFDSAKTLRNLPTFLPMIKMRNDLKPMIMVKSTVEQNKAAHLTPKKKVALGAGVLFVLGTAGYLVYRLRRK